MLSEMELLQLENASLMDRVRLLEEREQGYKDQIRALEIRVQMGQDLLEGMKNYVRRYEDKPSTERDSPVHEKETARHMHNRIIRTTA